METWIWSDSAGVNEVIPVGFQPSLVRSTNYLFTFARKQQQIKVGLVCALFGDLIPSTGSLIRPLYTSRVNWLRSTRVEVPGAMLIFTRKCSDLATQFPYVKELVGFFSELKLVIKCKSFFISWVGNIFIVQVLAGEVRKLLPSHGMYLFHLACSLRSDCVLAAAMCVHLWVPECWCHSPCLSGLCFH